MNWIERRRLAKNARFSASQAEAEDEELKSDLKYVQRLYELMPQPELVGTWRAIQKSISRIGQAKSSADILAFFLKILPPILLFSTIPFIGIVVWLFKNTFFWLYKNNIYLLIVFITFLASMVMFTALWLYMQSRLHRRLLSRDVHKDFKILQDISAAYIISKDKAVYAFRWIVEPKVDGIEQFSIMHNWTGDGAVRVVPRNARWKVSKSKKVRGNFSRSDITFDEKLRAGRIYIIEYSIITPKSSVTPSPHLGISILNRKYPFFNCHLLVAFEATCRPIEVRREFYLGGFSQQSVDSAIVTLDESGSHHFPVKPQFNWSYCIAWEFGE